MGIGASIFLIAIGAILAFALGIDPTPVAGVSIDWVLIGYILMVVGVVGLVWSLIALSAARDDVEDDDVVVERRRRMLD